VVRGSTCRRADKKASGIGLAQGSQHYLSRISTKPFNWNLTNRAQGLKERPAHISNIRDKRAQSVENSFKSSRLVTTATSYDHLMNNDVAGCRSPGSAAPVPPP